MKGIIMAGGHGKRLRPLTCDLPKPMVPLLNKPVMEYSIELLKDHGITDIGVTTCYLPEMIKNYFEDGKRWGIDLQYFDEKEPLGTAGSVRNATDFLDETFIVVSGDALTDINLSEAIRFHKEKGGIATLVLSRREVPLEFGVVMIDKNDQIIRFLEKPSWGEVFSDLVNTGIYIFEPDIFDYYDKGEKYDFSKDLFPLLMRDGQALYGYVSNGYWSDIGDTEQYMQTQFDILTGKADVYIRGQQVEEGIWVGEDTHIPGDVMLEAPIYIGEDVVIKRGCHLSATVVGDHSIIESGSSLKRSILWSGVYLGKNSEIRACFLCDGVKLKDNVRVFEGAVLGKDSTVGHGVTIQSDVKVWPMKEVEDYTNLNRSLVWAPKWKKRLFNTYGVHGLANIEMTPEFVAKLATAYGSSFKRGVEIVVSSDNFAIPKMLKKSIAAGLLSAGLRVLDLGEIPSPVSRYGVAEREVEGGIHVRYCYDKPEEVIIEFIDKNGLKISRGTERDIEKRFFNEDFYRAQEDFVGEYYYSPQMVKSYVDGLLTLVDKNKIKKKRYNLLIDYEYDSLSPILPVLLDRLGCEYESTNNYGEGIKPLSYTERLSTIRRLQEVIFDNGYDLGVIMDHNGENLKLITSRGRAVTDEELQIITAMVLLNQGVNKLVVPVSSPAYIDDLAEEYGVEVIRTRSDKPTVMEHFYRETGVKGKPFFYPYDDAVATLVLILNFLAEQDIGLDELLNIIPAFYTCTEDIDCQWEEKGKIMRKLIEILEGEELELIDGVKVFHEHGWTLIYPDGDEPIFHVYTEADNPEIAGKISKKYADMIEEFQMEKVSV